jgi:hypothetical protein
VNEAAIAKLQKKIINLINFNKEEEAIYEYFCNLKSLSYLN